MMAARGELQAPQLAELLSGMYQGGIAPCGVQGLSLHADEVLPGYVFFALAGTRVHGIEFAYQAISNGACAIAWQVTDQLQELPAELVQAASNAGVLLLAMPQLQQQVGLVAERFYGSPSKAISVVGITGTNGKTSCSHFIAQAMRQQTSCAVIGTLGNGLLEGLAQSSHTTPDAIRVHELLHAFKVQGATVCAMEVSSHGLEQGRVNGVNFEVAVFTNLSHDHLDYHGNMQSYAEAKARLFSFPGLKNAVINRDDAVGRQLLDSLKAGVNAISYSVAGDERADLLVRDIKATHSGLEFVVNGKFGKARVQSQLVGRFNVGNLLAVMGGLLALGVSFEQAIDRLQKLETVPGRMQRIAMYEPQLPLVVVDYAHTPDALESALMALHEHSQTDAGAKLWCVFGCGGDRDQAKRAPMGAAAAKWAERVVLTNDNPRSENPDKILADIQAGINPAARVEVIAQRRDAIAHVVTQADSGDVVLVAGKGHEQYQIDKEGKHFYPGDYSVCEFFLKQRLQRTGCGGSI